VGLAFRRTHLLSQNVVGGSVATLAADLELMRELGVTRINTVALDPSLDRCIDQIGNLVAMAEALDMETTLEFAPGMTIADLPSALRAVTQINKSSFRLVLDTMHFFRSGSGLEELKNLDPAVIGYVQINDVPLGAHHADYMQEAMFERLLPGTGELPLREFLTTVPAARSLSD
jgi:sugar phosphate isomerase/epimerase